MVSLASFAPSRAANGSLSPLRRSSPRAHAFGAAQLVYMPDQIGSVRDVVNVSGPSVVYSQDFTPYGNTVFAVGSTAPVFGFAGLVADPNSGLSYSASRFYDPTSGRWIHRDPIGAAGGLDLYAYAGGNPIIRTDPEGTADSPSWVGQQTPVYTNFASGQEIANGNYETAAKYTAFALLEDLDAGVHIFVKECGGLANFFMQAFPAAKTKSAILALPTPNPDKDPYGNLNSITSKYFAPLNAGADTIQKANPATSIGPSYP
jgi:RHS repeat-associated protein